MPMRAVSRGVTEYCSAITSATVNVRSLTPGLSCAGHLAACLDLLEEFVDEFADLVAAVEAAPQHSQSADELVAGVDGDQVTLGRGVAFRVGVITVGHSHQQRFDIVGEHLQ